MLQVYVLQTYTTLSTAKAQHRAHPWTAGPSYSRWLDPGLLGVTPVTSLMIVILPSCKRIIWAVHLVSKDLESLSAFSINPLFCKHCLTKTGSRLVTSFVRI